MKSKTANRIITSIWIIIGLSAGKSIITLITMGMHYTSQPFLFWLSVLNLITACLLFAMSFRMRKIVHAYTEKKSWNESNYRSMKNMGYMAVGLVFIQTLFKLGYECIWILISQKSINFGGIFVFRRFYAILLTESPIVWVLALSILLFAELLKAAHQVKAENESFI